MNVAGRPERLGSRRFDLDWLRIGAFALLVPYHVGLLYVPWPYHAKSLQIVPGLVAPMMAVNPWRLLLLFFISGVATRHASTSRTPMRLLADRSKRLLTPLLFGMALIVPPQVWVQARQQFGERGSYPAFLLDHGLGLGLWGTLCRHATCLALPAWNHLWFLAYLWVYVAAACLAAAALRPGAKACARVAAALSGPSVVIVMPMIVLGLARWTLFDAHPPDQALWGDWYAHAIYGTGFAMGYTIADRPMAWAAMERLRWGAVTLVVAVILVVAAGMVRLKGLSGCAVVAVYQWAAVVALCGFARRHLAHRDGGVRRYLGAAILPCYLLHQTVIVLLAALLRDRGWPAAVEGPAIVACTLLVSLLGFEVVRRIGWLAPFFGLSPHRDLERPQSVRTNAQ